MARSVSCPTLERFDERKLYALSDYDGYDGHTVLYGYHNLAGFIFYKILVVNQEFCRVLLVQVCFKLVNIFCDI